MKQVKVSPLSRVEGCGGITVEVREDGSPGHVHFDILEGARLMEPLLKGRAYEDVAPVASRICAICSVSHTVASLSATENAFGVEVSRRTHLLRELLCRGEHIASHALHVFVLALPDYMGYPDIVSMAGEHASTVRLGLRLKKLGNLIQETVGGRAVHPVNAVVGGFGRVPKFEEILEMRRCLEESRPDCDAMMEALLRFPEFDFCSGDTVFAALECSSHYEYCGGRRVAVLNGSVRESFAGSDYRLAVTETSVAHSHAKHSKYKGKPFMVGALARVLVNRERLPPLASEAFDRLGIGRLPGNPMDNNKAQAVEILADVERSLQIVNALLEGETEGEDVVVRTAGGSGTGVVEAPRGLLFHHYVYDDLGRVVEADVVTPTALNAACIEDHFRLTVSNGDGSGLPLETRLEMIARAYDPCISCSVHLIRR